MHANGGRCGLVRVWTWHCCGGGWTGALGGIRHAADGDLGGELRHRRHATARSCLVRTRHRKGWLATRLRARGGALVNFAAVGGCGDGVAGGRESGA